MRSSSGIPTESLDDDEEATDVTSEMSYRLEGIDLAVLTEVDVAIEFFHSNADRAA